jgi:hypothetical protein
MISRLEGTADSYLVYGNLILFANFKQIYASFFFAI